MAEQGGAAARKFDADRAGAYAQQSRIALAGYDACHELAACMLAAALGRGAPRAAAGRRRGRGRHGDRHRGGPRAGLALHRRRPLQRHDGPDGRAAGAGRTRRPDRDRPRPGGGPPRDATYDAATLIGVLHHLPGDAEKRAILHAIAGHLRPGRPWCSPATTTPTRASPCSWRPGASAGASRAPAPTRSRPGAGRSCRAPTRPTPRRPSRTCWMPPASGRRPASSPACSGARGSRAAVPGARTAREPG